MVAIIRSRLVNGDIRYERRRVLKKPATLVASEECYRTMLLLYVNQRIRGFICWWKPGSFISPLSTASRFIFVYGGDMPTTSQKVIAHMRTNLEGIHLFFKSSMIGNYFELHKITRKRHRKLTVYMHTSTWKNEILTKNPSIHLIISEAHECGKATPLN